MTSVIEYVFQAQYRTKITSVQLRMELNMEEETYKNRSFPNFQNPS